MHVGVRKWVFGYCPFQLGTFSAVSGAEKPHIRVPIHNICEWLSHQSAVFYDKECPARFLGVGICSYADTINIKSKFKEVEAHMFRSYGDMGCSA